MNQKGYESREKEAKRGGYRKGRGRGRKKKEVLSGVTKGGRLKLRKEKKSDMRKTL